MSSGSSLSKITDISSNFILSVESNNLTLGSSITTWNDNSGTSNDLTAILNPTQVGTTILDSNGYQCVNWSLSEGSKYITTNSQVQPTEITIAMVIDVQLNSTISGIFAQSASADRITIVFNTLEVVINSAFSFSLDTGVLPLGKSLIIFRRTSTNYEIYIRGVKVKSGTFTGTLGGSSKYTIGQYTAGLNLLGSIYQLHICNEYLDNEKLKKLSRYMSFKSGLTI